MPRIFPSYIGLFVTTSMLIQLFAVWNMETCSKRGAFGSVKPRLLIRMTDGPSFLPTPKRSLKTGFCPIAGRSATRKKKFSRLIIGEHGELAADGEALESRPDAFDTQVSLIETLSLLDACKKDYDGVTRLGIEALALKLQGMRVTDIAELYQVPPSHVGAWISRSTAKLRRDSKFLKSLL